jgi:hypothetical protein
MSRTGTPRLRRESHDDANLDTARERVRRPDGRLVLVSTRYGFENPDPSADADEIAEKIVTFSNLLHRWPTTRAEAHDLPARVKELLPRLGSEQG